MKDILLNDDFDISFFESLVDEQPNFVEALDCLGNLYTKIGRYEDGLRIDLKLVSLKPADSFAWYNLACSYSLLEDYDPAVTALKKSVELGYTDLSYMMQDSDLNNLRSTDLFLEFVESLELDGEILCNER